MIISIQSQKGGVGKTTLAVNLSFELARHALEKSRVLLVDSDPQGSARDWAAAREEKPPFDVIGMDRPTLHRDLKPVAENYTHVIIDGPPRVSELARSGIIAADLILIPIQPSPYDVWAAEETVKLVQEASVFKENLKALFVINRKIVNTAIGRDVVEALASYNLPIAQVQICQRVVFAESAANGSAVSEVAPSSKATQELKGLIKEILSYAEKES